MLHNREAPLAQRLLLEADGTLVRGVRLTRRCSWTVDAEPIEMGFVYLLEKSINIGIVQIWTLIMSRDLDPKANTLDLNDDLFSLPRDFVATPDPREMAAQLSSLVVVL